MISALGIDLVGEGRTVISKSMEAGGQAGCKNGKKRPAITVHQVSHFFFIYIHNFQSSFVYLYLALFSLNVFLIRSYFIR